LINVLPTSLYISIAYITFIAAQSENDGVVCQKCDKTFSKVVKTETITFTPGELVNVVTSGAEETNEETKETTNSDGLGPRYGLKLRIPVINNYGCWCYGGDSWPGARDQSGMGPTMDEYDEACKAHHMGFDCITMDARADNEVCKPTETSYELKVTPLGNGDYLLECSDSIENEWCQRRVCLVDLRFIARHWKLEELNIEPTYATYGHAGYHDNVGDFDTSVCVSRPGGTGNGSRTRVRVCCGDYPYRIWYDRNNNRGVQCCTYEDNGISEDYGFPLQIGSLFNGLSETCCPDGVVSGSTVC